MFDLIAEGAVFGLQDLSAESLAVLGGEEAVHISCGNEQREWRAYRLHWCRLLRPEASEECTEDCVQSKQWWTGRFWLE